MPLVLVPAVGFAINNLGLSPSLNLHELSTLYPVSLMELVPSIKGINSPI